MGAKNTFERENPGDSSGTLGALLYADKTQPLVAEGEWVALVRQIAAGQAQALQALYQRTHRIAFTLIVRITGNHETAEEVTLDLFHDVWRRAAAYDPANGSVLGWIMNQARSRAIDRVRFEQRTKRVNAFPEDALPAVVPLAPQESLEQAQQARQLHHALTQLSAPERQAIEIAYLSELTYADVAARLDQPLGTIKTRIRTGLQKLKKALSGVPEK